MEDKRVKFVILIAFLCVLASVVIYYTGHGRNPETFFGATFASWIGGLALFIITGIIIFFFSMARPETGSFDSRARILFRGQSGQHIDYIVERIKGMLEHYAERTEIRITIRSFDVGESKYRISSSNTALVRSYIDDVETTYVSALGRNDVTSPPAGGEPNRLVYLRMNGDPIGTSEDFQNAFKRAVSCRIARNESCNVSWLMDYWVRANEESNTHTTRRYTQNLTLTFENLIPRSVNLTLNLGGDQWISEQLPSGASKRVAVLNDIWPQTVAYNYKLLA